MPTPGERRALLFFASVALLGAGWRTVRASGARLPTDDERAALDQQIAVVDSARASSGRRGENGRTGRGLGQGTTAVRAQRTLAHRGANGLVDVDRATAEELEVLPRIGPSLAKRIVADRDSLGPFGSLEALQRVRGIGPAMAREIAPRVTFSAPIEQVGGPPARGPPTGPRRDQPMGRSPPPLWSSAPPGE